MISSGAPSAFFKELKKDQQSFSAQSAVDINNITMLRCLRWVMKNHGMNVEIKRANVVASTMMNLQLVKANQDEQFADTKFRINITDSKIEKGLFELEYEIMQNASVKPMYGFYHILDQLRENKLSLPPHYDLRNEIVMNGHILRISYLGTDNSSGKDLFGGFLLLNDKVVCRTEPQTRMGFVLDNLENAIFAKRRESYRKCIGEQMLKFYADDYTAK